MFLYKGLYFKTVTEMLCYALIGDEYKDTAVCPF